MALLVILVHQKIMGYDQEGCSAPRWTVLNEDEYGLTLKQRSGRCKLELDLRGELRWNEGEDAIAWMERSGRLDVEHRTADARHRLKVRGSANGEPEVTYWRDGDERQLDEQAQAWLHEIAMVMFRRLGVDAEARSARIFEQSGTDGLVKEIRAIESDRIATLYARAAFAAPPDVRTEAVTEVLRGVARHVGSDYSVAELLVDLADSGLPVDSSATPGSSGASETFERSLRDLLATVGSDYDVRRSVQALLDAGAGPAQTEALLKAAALGIGSDYEAAEVVVSYAEDLEPGADLSRGVHGLLHTIGSDYELRRSLVALLDGGRTDDDLRKLLSVAHTVGSDYDLAEVLVTVARRNHSPAIEDSYRSTLQLIGSDFERQRAEDAWKLQI